MSTPADLASALAANVASFNAPRRPLYRIDYEIIYATERYSLNDDEEYNEAPMPIIVHTAHKSHIVEAVGHNEPCPPQFRCLIERGKWDAWIETIETYGRPLRFANNRNVLSFVTAAEHGALPERFLDALYDPQHPRHIRPAAECPHYVQFKATAAGGSIFSGHGFNGSCNCVINVYGITKLA